MAPISVIESDYLSQLTPADASPKASSEGDRYLGCYLEPDLTVALAVQKITEVLTIPTSEVTPIPHMSPWVMGVYNWRGEVLWMMDLGHLLGLTPWYQQTRHHAAHSVLIARTLAGTSIQEESKKIGLVVSQVRDIETLDSGRMQAPSPTMASPELAPFLQGYWLREEGDLLACLDVDAIFSMTAK